MPAWPTYSQLRFLKVERGGSAGLAIGWHAKVLAIRLRLDIPQALIDLRQLAALHRELGPARFHRPAGLGR